MMKVVFNAHFPDNVASMAYGRAFSMLEDVTLQDRDHYNGYDIGLFMGYPQDLKELARAKSINPKLLTGVVDPRGRLTPEEATNIDFFITDSLEMKDFFANYGKPQFLYYEYQDVPIYPKIHTEKKTIRLGYHGNQVHLTSMFPQITKALDRLGAKYDLELWAVYNVKNLGLWTHGRPSKIKVRDIQWTPDVYTHELSQVDIGIVPNLMPIRNLEKTKQNISISADYFLDNGDDYLLRFKMPSNIGRAVLFARLGVPLVLDMFPSALQWIQDEVNGFIAYSSGGWYQALDKLIQSAALRQQISDAAAKTFASLDYAEQNKGLLAFLKTLRDSKVSQQGPVFTLGTVQDLSGNLSFKWRLWQRKGALLKYKWRKLLSLANHVKS